MPLTVDKAKELITGDVRLTADLLGLGSGCATLFTAPYLGVACDVAHTAHDVEHLVLWGRAAVAGAPCPVEIHFVADATGTTVVALRVHVGLDRWESPLLPQELLSTLEALGLSAPEVLLSVPARPWDPGLGIAAAARLRATTAPAVPERILARCDTPGFATVESDFATAPGAADPTALLRVLPFAGHLPAVALPTPVADLVKTDFRLTHLCLDVDQSTGLPVGGEVSVAVTLRDPGHTDEFLTLDTIVLKLRIRAGRFAVGADIAGRIGGAAAALHASWGDDGDCRIEGCVRADTLDGALKSWLDEHVDPGLAGILDHARLTSMFAAAEVRGRARTLEAGFEVVVDLHGRSATLAVRGSKPPDGGATVHAAMEYPAPTEGDPTRAMLFQGTCTSGKGRPPVFDLTWACPAPGVRVDAILPVPH